MSEESLAAGTHLRYRLERNASRGAQAGCTFAVSLFLGAIGGGLLFAGARSEDNGVVLYAVGGFLSFLALFLLYSAIHQWLAMKTPETIVEIDRDLLVRGSEVTLYFQQSGPASFESLRANLVGEESWHTGMGNRRSRHVKTLGTFNLFDSGPFEVGDVPYEKTVHALVPDVPHASDRTHAVTWQLEVWGKVRKRADFQHVYRIELRDAL